MAKSDPALQRKRITRLLIVLGVFVVLCGGFFALYQLNRTAPPVLTEADIIQDAKEAFEEDDYDTAAELLEKPSNRDTTLDGIQDDADMLRMYIAARRDAPLFNNRHLTRIIAPLKQLIELDPQDRESKLDLMDTLLVLERGDEALLWAQKLVEQYPDDAVILRQLARAQLEQNQFEAARMTLEQAIVIEPLDVPTHAQVLDILTDGNEQLEPFAERAAAIFAQHPQDPRAAMILSMANEAMGDNIQAIDLLKQAAAMTPPNPDIVPMLVQWLDRSAMHTVAHDYLQEHAPSGIDNPAGRLAIYRAFETGDYEVMLARLKDSNPADANTDLLAMWASALIQTGDDEAADKRLEELAKRDTVIASTWGKLLELDRQDEATVGATIETIVEALEAPDEFERAMARRHPYLMQRLGEAYLRAEEPEIAYSAMMVASQNSRTWARPQRGLAQTLMELGQPQAALFHAKQAIDRQGDDASRMWLIIAMATAADADDKGLVDRTLHEANKLPKGSPEAWEVLPITIDLLARSNRSDELTQRINEALAGPMPADVDALEALLQVSTRRGLGLNATLEQTIESAFDVTPGLALLRARAIASDQGDEKGLQALKSAAPEPPTKRWQMATADYLLGTDPARAGLMLLDLAEQYPDDLTLQLAALQSNEPSAENERFKAALDRLRELAGETTIHWRLQQSRLALQDPEDEQGLLDTVAILNEAEPLTPVHTEVRTVLARCYLILQNNLAAVERAQAARSIEPDNPLALLLHGKALHELKRYEEARLDLTRVAGDTDLDPGMRFKACLLLNDQGHYPPVQKAIEQMWSEGQATGEALVLLARIYIREGAYAKADVVCDALLKEPDAQSLRFVSTYSYQMGRADRVKKAIDAAQSDRISEADRLVILAEDAARRGEIADSITHIKGSVQAEPNNPQRWYDAVQLLLSVAQPTEAVSLAKQGVAALTDVAGLASLAEHEKLVLQINEDASLIPLAVTILSSEEFREQSIEALRLTQKQGRSEEAAIGLAELAKKYPDFKYLQELACDRLLRADQNDRAYALAKSAMARFPESAATARVAALTAFRLQDWPMLLSAANAWGQRNPQDRANADLMRAAAMNQLDRYGAAIKTLKPYIDLQENVDAGNELMFEYYSRALVRSGNHSAAWQTLSPHLAVSPQARTIALKRISEDLEDEQAIRDWHKIIAARSDESPRTQFELAKAPFLAGQRLNIEGLVRLADERMTRQLLAAGDFSVDMVYAKGQIAQRLGNLDQAESSYRKVLQTVPDNPLVLNNLALVLSERGASSLAEAEQLAKRAVKLSDRDPNLIDTLAIVLMRSGQYDAALETIEMAIELSPSNPAWRMTMADILEAKGETEQAEVIRQRYAPRLQQ